MARSLSAHLPTPVMRDWTPDEIRDLRKKRLGYNQAQMAAALGYGSLQRVSELERGEAPVTDQVRLLLSHIAAHGDLVDRRTG